MQTCHTSIPCSVCSLFSLYIFVQILVTHRYRHTRSLIVLLPIPLLVLDRRRRGSLGLPFGWLDDQHRAAGVMAEVVAHAAQERPAIAVTNNHEPRRIWILHRADGVRGYLLILPRPRLPRTRSPACILSTAWQMASLASPSTTAAVASTCRSLHRSRARARICREFSSLWPSDQQQQAASTG